MRNMQLARRAVAPDCSVSISPPSARGRSASDSAANASSAAQSVSSAASSGAMNSWSIAIMRAPPRTSPACATSASGSDRRPSGWSRPSACSVPCTTSRINSSRSATWSGPRCAPAATRRRHTRRRARDQPAVGGEGEHVGGPVVSVVPGIQPPHPVPAEKRHGHVGSTALALEYRPDHPADHRGR